MATDYRHSQEWWIRITPDEGEHWPREYAPDGQEFAPDAILLHARTGWRTGIKLSGKMIKQDGTPGKRRTGTTWLPAWAAEKMAAEREARGLSDEFFASQGARSPLAIPAVIPERRQP